MQLRSLHITLDNVYHFADTVDLQPVSFDVGDGNFVPLTGKNFNLVVEVTSAASTILGPFQSRLHLSDEPTLMSANKLLVRPNAAHRTKIKPIYISSGSSSKWDASFYNWLEFLLIMDLNVSLIFFQDILQEAIPS